MNSWFAKKKKKRCILTFGSLEKKFFSININSSFFEQPFHDSPGQPGQPGQENRQDSPLWDCRDRTFKTGHPGQNR
jgi:hypothetical protein